MKSPRALFRLSLAASAALCPRAAFAWSANGHKTVALIAESRLSDAAKAAVAAILGPTATLDAIAPCADDIRGKTGYDCAGIKLDDDPQSEPWHFLDVPISASPADGAALKEYCPGSTASWSPAAPCALVQQDQGVPPKFGGCVVDQICANFKTLSSPQADAAHKQVALMFLVHFVGDEHQPLHGADEIVDGVNDRGGNLKNVSFHGVAPEAAPEAAPKAGPDAAREPLNLHALWDHQILPEDSNDPGATSQRLIAALQGKDVSSWLEGNFVSSAALESFSIAKNNVYPAYYAPNGKSIDSSYQARMTPIVDERLERAGVRLAALLETALVGPAPGAPAAAPTPAPPASGASALDGVRSRVKEVEATPP